MNDRQQPYGQIYGYDAYGRPLYQPPRDPSGEQSRPADQPPGYQEGDYDAGYGYPGPPDFGYQDQQGQPGAQPGGYPASPAGGQPGYPGQQPGYQGWDPYGSDTGAQPPVPPADGTGGYPGPGGHPGEGGYPGAGGGYPAQGYGYAQQAPPQAQPQVHPQVPQQGYGYPQGVSQDTGPQPPVVDHGWDTGQQHPVVDRPAHDTGRQAPVPAAPPAAGEPAGPGVPEQRRPAPEESYETEEFSFVDEQDEESEDVIDWLKFSESRTERREEAKRRGRSRRRLLVVTLVLALVGGVGFLWSTDRLPFLGGDAEDGAAGAGAEVRDVIVVHLWPVDSAETATALLVANETAGTGATLLLPNELSVTPDGGTTTLGQAVADESAGSVRDALGALLGADIKGTWRLNTPSLANLVDLVSGITVTTDAEVPGADGDEGPLVEVGENVPLNGQAAVAYATHRADDEPQAAQLARFGQVMEAVLARLPATESTAVTAMENLRQIHDPSLSEQELGVSLATLAGFAQSGDYTTAPLPVEEDGTVSDETADGLVDEVLGGSVSNAQPGGAVRIGIRDATGTGALGEAARITLVNGGMTVIDNRVVAESAAESSILYSVPEHREAAVDAARTLGLPEEVVTEGDGPGTADVTVVLGQDYGP